MKKNPIREELCKILLEYGANFKLYKIDSFQFRGFKPLVGNRFAYSKLLIPDILRIDRVIYFDTDTIVDTDVVELWKFDLNGAPAAARIIYPVSGAIESEFLQSVGLNLNDRYFNTGVMILDLKILRAMNFSEKAIKFSEVHEKNLATADQTVITVLLNHKIEDIDTRFNTIVPPNEDLKNYERGKNIFHFVGAPKPWDAFSSKIHKGYWLWEEYLPIELKENFLN